MLTQRERDDVNDLIERLKSEELQEKLLPGFQQSFSTNVLGQWEKYQNLSEAQIDKLKELVEQLETGQRSPASTPSTFSKRRYEGHDPRKR